MPEYGQTDLPGPEPEPTVEQLQALGAIAEDLRGLQGQVRAHLGQPEEPTEQVSDMYRRVVGDRRDQLIQQQTERIAELESQVERFGLVCPTCWTSSFEPTENGLRCLVCWQAERLVTSQAELARLRSALKRAAVHLEIDANRMRGCHAETGKHELLFESEAFVREACEALAPAPERPAGGANDV